MAYPDEELFTPYDWNASREAESSLGHGDITGGYKSRALQLSGEAAKSEDNAMNYLRQALNNSKEITPQQGLAAALLAAIPTLGGYMMGKQTKIPQGVYGIKDFAGNNTGAGFTGSMGAQAGFSAGQGYLTGLDKRANAEDDILRQMSQIESRKSERLMNDADNYTKAALDKQAQIDFLPLNEASQIRISQASQGSALANSMALEKFKNEQEVMPPEQLAVLQKELGLPLNPNMNPSQLRVAIAAKEAARRDTGQDFRQSQSEVPGYKTIGKAALTPTTAAKIQEQNFGLAKTKALIDQYISMPDVVTGETSAAQQAIAGMMVNAQRIATGSGATFTDTEQQLIKDALPAIKAGDLANWVKQNSLGRDQRVFAETLKGIYQKTQDIGLAEGYGIVRNDVPLNYYPKDILARHLTSDELNSVSFSTNQASPVRKGNLTPEQYSAAMEEINMLLAKKGK